MAPCDDECCSEMIDFGLLPPLMVLVRERNPPLEVSKLYTQRNVFTSITIECHSRGP